jgi:phage FluMu protein Com
MSGVLKFRCENCGQLLSINPAQAGRKGRCPTCKWMLTIPEQGIEAAPETVEPGLAPEVRLRDAALLDLPARADDASDTPEAAYQRLRALQGGRILKDSEEPPTRKLPWLIDIFLYPLNKPGLTILALSAGVPFLLRIVVKFFMYFSGAFGAMLVFWVLAVVVHHATLALFTLYIGWYAGECIRDSAAGAIRAADSMAATPGFGELLGRFFTIIVTAGVCLAPGLVYVDQTRSLDGLFWVLYAIGGFVFPMALLAVVMHESLAGLNPLLLLPSILRTLLPYCFLVPFCYALCLLLPVAGLTLFRIWILGYVLLFLAYYQLLVLAHLLGRFYWKNEQRLNWDA